ncbi:MAG TPA: hypothetical protein VHV29_15105 [Terriglobales bacterium]|nr:hypothetical protein [Terriglobales bacterium]
MRVLLLFLISAACFSQTDSRVPPEVKFKSGYVNPAGKPPAFTSAMLWGIAIADTRVTGFEKAQVVIAATRLSCRVDGKDVILNHDRGNVRGGLYRRHPWFGTDEHTSMPLAYSDDHSVVILKVGARPDRVWHFWAASPRVTLPPGHLEGCTVIVRARISAGAVLQVGMDYWRNSTVGYGPGGNNHEAGASDWYFPSPDWQEATFTDVR